MNDNITKDTLEEIFQTLEDNELDGLDDFQDIDEVVGHLEDIETFDTFNDADEELDSLGGFEGLDDLEDVDEGNLTFAMLNQEYGFLDQDEEEIEGFEGFGDFADLDAFQAEEAIATDSDAADLEPGINWSAIFWLVLLLGSTGLLSYNEFTENIRSENQSRLETTASQLDANIRDIGQQTLLASGGDFDAFSSLSNIKSQINSNLSLLKTGDEANQINPVPIAAATELREIEQAWNEIQPDIDIVLNSQGAIESTISEVAAVNDLTPQLLTKTNNLVTSLIDNQASLDLINLASRQRFLSQRIKATLNEFVGGSSDWEGAATQFGQDVRLFGQINNSVSNTGGDAVIEPVSEIEPLYQQLMSSAEGVMSNVGDYFAVRSAVSRIIESNESIRELSNGLQAILSSSDDMMMGIPKLPLILVVIALVSLFSLIWSIIRFSRRYAQSIAQRTQVSEDAVIKLLDEMGDLAQGDLTVEAEVTDEVTGAIADSINFAVGEMRGLVNGIKGAAGEMNEATEGTESLIAQLLTSSDVQSQEILNSVDDVSRMANAINTMSDSASRSSEQARVSAEVAQKGVSAVRNTVRGMNNARNQIQETAKQLKRLGESSQQINEIVNLIQDVSEQTNVLSLNASIQAAMAGEAGRGFAVVAEEVQRLADRSNRASNEITELVKNIQQDANSAISSMELTTEEVVSGATTADEAGQALNEIESMSQELLTIIDQVAGDARDESKVAKTVAGRMEKLQEATTESDLSVSQVAVALEQMRSVADQLNQSIAGFKLPEQA